VFKRGPEQAHLITVNLLKLSSVWALWPDGRVHYSFRGFSRTNSLVNIKRNYRAVLEVCHSDDCSGDELSEQQTSEFSLPTVSTPKINFGVYDPEGQCSPESEIAIEHVFVSWANYQPGTLLMQLAQIELKGRWPFITIEPWCDRTITTLSSQLLNDVVEGRYDRTIQQMASEIAAFHGLVVLRWGHAMENVMGRYPWANHQPALYREAYRHFVTACRLAANNVAFVWSPVGDNDLACYWPGEHYVDSVGLSVFEPLASDQVVGHQVTRSFHDQMIDKYARVALYNKPVMIAECGITGSEECQLNWLSDASRDFAQYPLLKALIYFNAKETPALWSDQDTTPDWRLGVTGFRSQESGVAGEGETPGDEFPPKSAVNNLS